MNKLRLLTTVCLLAMTPWGARAEVNWDTMNEAYKVFLTKDEYNGNNAGYEARISELESRLNGVGSGGSGGGTSVDAYSKTEIDTKLGDLNQSLTNAIIEKADADDVYTKDEADEKFAGKGDVYTKTDVDTALEGKASIDDLDAAKSDITNNTTNITNNTNKINELQEKLDGLELTGGGVTEEEVNTIVDSKLGDKLDQVDTNTTAIEELDQTKANADDVYTKDEADEKFADKGDVYTKTEVDTALEGKASKDDLDAAKSDITNNTTAIGVNTKAIADLGSQVGDHENRIIANEGAIDKLDQTKADKSAVEQNAKDIAANKKEIGEINDRVDGVEKDVADNKKVIEDHEDRIAANEEAIANHDSKIETNEKNIANNSERITANSNAIREFSNTTIAVGNVSELVNTHYASSSTNLTSAVQALDSQVYKLDNDLSQLRYEVSDLRKDVNAGLASVAALTALVPNARAMGDTQLSIGTGAYNGHTAMAIGGFHWVNDNVLLNAGASWGNNSQAAYKMGVTWSW